MMPFTPLMLPSAVDAAHAIFFLLLIGSPCLMALLMPVRRYL